MFKGEDKFHKKYETLKKVLSKFLKIGLPTQVDDEVLKISQKVHDIGLVLIEIAYKCEEYKLPKIIISDQDELTLVWEHPNFINFASFLHIVVDSKEIFMRWYTPYAGEASLTITEFTGWSLKKLLRDLIKETV